MSDSPARFVPFVPVPDTLSANVFFTAATVIPARRDRVEAHS